MNDKIISRKGFFVYVETIVVNLQLHNIINEWNERTLKANVILMICNVNHCFLYALELIYNQKENCLYIDELLSK